MSASRHRLLHPLFALGLMSGSPDLGICLSTTSSHFQRMPKREQSMLASITMPELREVGFDLGLVSGFSLL